MNAKVSKEHVVNYPSGEPKEDRASRLCAARKASCTQQLLHVRNKLDHQRAASLIYVLIH